MFIDKTLTPLPADATAAARAAAWRLVLPGDTPVWDEARRRWSLSVYDLGEVLALQHRADLLDGLPERDLPADAWGYLDFPPHEKHRLDRALTAWEDGGYYIAVRPYAVQNQKRLAYRIRRIKLTRLIQRGLLTEAQVAWIEMVCAASAIARQEHQAARAQPNGHPKKRRKPKKPSRRKKKQRKD